MAYLLDTNIISNLIRDPHGQVAARIRAVGESSIRTSIVVAAELRFGVHRNGSSRLAERLARILERLEVVPLSSPADDAYGTIRTHLERAGTPIGCNDLLIAAHTLALGDTLVTDHQREFARVPGLSIENWLR